MLHKALDDAGLPKQRFRDLGHACATYLVARGVPWRTVMEIPGHSTISLTANRYSHISLAVAREAAEAIGAVG